MVDDVPPTTVLVDFSGRDLAVACADDPVMDIVESMYRFERDVGENFYEYRFTPPQIAHAPPKPSPLNV